MVHPFIIVINHDRVVITFNSKYSYLSFGSTDCYFQSTHYYFEPYHPNNDHHYQSISPYHCLNQLVLIPIPISISIDL